jgi:hypothetical protein
VVWGEGGPRLNWRSLFIACDETESEKMVACLLWYPSENFPGRGISGDGCGDDRQSRLWEPAPDHKQGCGRLADLPKRGRMEMSDGESIQVRE